MRGCVWLCVSVCVGEWEGVGPTDTRFGSNVTLVTVDGQGVALPPAECGGGGGVCVCVVIVVWCVVWSSV